MEYVGIDWAYRRAAWCALGEGGAVSGEGVVAADEDGLARLVVTLGTEVRACVEMMSGAVWVRDRLAAVGWRIDVACAASGGRHGRRLRALIVVLWRAGLRIHEALALSEPDLDRRRASLLAQGHSRTLAHDGVLALLSPKSSKARV